MAATLAWRRWHVSLPLAPLSAPSSADLAAALTDDRCPHCRRLLNHACTLHLVQRQGFVGFGRATITAYAHAPSTSQLPPRRTPGTSATPVTLRVTRFCTEPAPRRLGGDSNPSPTPRSACSQPKPQSCSGFMCLIHQDSGLLVLTGTTFAPAQTVQCSPRRTFSAPAGLAARTIIAHRPSGPCAHLARTQATLAARAALARRSSLPPALALHVGHLTTHAAIARRPSWPDALPFARRPS